jgi:hypothetical protein
MRDPFLYVAILEELIDEDKQQAQNNRMERLRRQLGR